MILLQAPFSIEKEMAAHYSILAWKIPWTEEPGGLYSPWGLIESDTIDTYIQKPALYVSEE